MQLMKEAFQGRLSWHQGLLAAWVLILLTVGLTTQSLRSVYAYTSFALALIALVWLLVGTQHWQRLSSVQTTFALWMTLVAVLVPLFASQSPLLSLEFGFVVGLGCLLMAFFTPDLARWVLYALVGVCLIDSVVSTTELVIDGQQRAFGLYSDLALRTLYLWISAVFLYFTVLEGRSHWQSGWRFALIGFLLFGLHTAQSFTVNFLVIVGYLWIGLFTLIKARHQWRQYAVFAVVGLISYGVYLGFAAVVDVSGIRELSHVNTLNGRTPLYETAWQLVQEAPWFGVGSGLFMYLYPSIRTEWGTAGLNVHNDYLEYWATTGVVGALPLVLIALYFVYRNLLAMKEGNLKDLVFSGLILSAMASAFLNFFFWRMENFILFAALWCLLDAERAEDRPFTTAQRISVAMLMLLPFVVLSARLYEHAYAEFSADDRSLKPQWSERVLQGDSGLLPLRASRATDHILQTGQSPDPAVIADLLARLDRAIEKNSLLPHIYCVRGELGMALGESPDQLFATVAKGVATDPGDAYCQSVIYNIRLAQGDLYGALSSLRQYVLAPQARQANVEQLRPLIQRAAYDAYNGQEPVFARFFSRITFEP